MPIHTSMHINEPGKYSKMMQERYGLSNRPGSAGLLNEMEQTLGPYRKSLVRLMDSDLKRKPSHKQREPVH